MEGEIDEEDLSSREDFGDEDEIPEDLEDVEESSKQSRELENDDLADLSSRDVDDDVTDRREDDVTLGDETEPTPQDEIQLKEISQSTVAPDPDFEQDQGLSLRKIKK